jgi:HemY protein
VLLTLIVTVTVSLLAMEDPGYLLIAVGSWTLETTLTLAIVVVVLSFVSLYYLLRLGAGLRRVPGGLRHWRQQRRQRRAERALSQGLIELAEGHWPAAERDLVKYARQGHSPLLNYLAAARAAQAQGADERRDQYLRLAHESHAGADIAVGLTQAELQLKHQQLEQALATLRHLQQLAPKHTQVLKALASLYRDLGDWEHLLEILPALRKRKGLEVAALDQLALEAYLALLRAAKGSAAVEAVWARVPKEFRDNESLLQAYVEHLLSNGSHALAEAALRQVLRRKPTPALVKMYGMIEGTEPAKPLVLVESLLADNKNDPVLLLTAGRLAMRQKLWGKARAYLEASINRQASAEAYNELGNLLEQLGEKEAAAECFHAGLRLVPGCEYPVASAVSLGKAVARDNERLLPQ